MTASYDAMALTLPSMKNFQVALSTALIALTDSKNSQRLKQRIQVNETLLQNPRVREKTKSRDYYFPIFLLMRRAIAP